MPLTAALLFGVALPGTGWHVPALGAPGCGIATAVAGHQIAITLVSMMFMMPLAIANAASTLVAQSVGAGEMRDARRVGWHGVELGLLVAAAMGASVYVFREALLRIYTNDPVIVGAALPLLAWLALFHVADAAQTVSAFVLRAYRIATVPVLIYALAIWGVGLGGGYGLAFDSFGWGLDSLRGAPGFWGAATLGLVLAGGGMCGFLGWVLRQQRGAG